MIYGRNRATFCERRTDPFDPEKECMPLCPLNAEEQEQVARNKATVYSHMPELLPWIKTLHEEKMIDGWRGVKVNLLKEVDHGNA